MNIINALIQKTKRKKRTPAQKALDDFVKASKRFKKAAESGAARLHYYRPEE